MIEPLTRGPGTDQLADQAPLRAAGVLEFVHQHVLVSRLEPIAAARELFHLPEQLERALEQIREIEHTMLVERAAVFVLGNREQPANAAGEDQVDVAAERIDRRLDVRPEAKDNLLVPVVLRRRLEHRLGVDRALAWLPLLREYQFGESIERPAKLRRT